MIALAMSAAVSVNAQDADVSPPAVPTAVTATANNANQVLIVWSASTDNVGVAGYYVYRNGGLIANTGSGSYIDSPAAGAYTYAVAAYDAAGNVSQRSSQTALVTIVSDTTPPSAPAHLVATVSSTSITLTWDLSSDNMAVAGYNVYRDGLQINSGPITTNTYVDSSGLISDRSYTYSVRAFDPSGNTSETSGVLARYDTTAPTTPPGLTASYISTNSIILKWQPGSDNIGLVGYYVFRNGLQLATTSGTTYTDTGLTTSTAYTYTVNSYDAAGNLSNPTAITVTTLAVAAPAPMPNVYAPTAALQTTIPPAGTAGGTNTTANGTTVSGNAIVFFGPLKFGVQSNDVKNLQLLLVKGGFLAPNFATGYFGSLTQKAVQAFQCKQAIVCSGGPLTTGWGAIGPRTKKALSTL